MIIKKVMRLVNQVGSIYLNYPELLPVFDFSHFHRLYVLSLLPCNQLLYVYSFPVDVPSNLPSLIIYLH